MHPSSALHTSCISFQGVACPHTWRARGSCGRDKLAALLRLDLLHPSERARVQDVDAAATDRKKTHAIQIKVFHLYYFLFLLSSIELMTAALPLQVDG